MHCPRWEISATASDVSPYQPALAQPGGTPFMLVETPFLGR
jgi:hypothetical protein